MKVATASPHDCLNGLDWRRKSFNEPNIETYAGRVLNNFPFWFYCQRWRIVQFHNVKRRAGFRFSSPSEVSRSYSGRWNRRHKLERRCVHRCAFDHREAGVSTASSCPRCVAGTLAARSGDKSSSHICAVQKRWLQTAARRKRTTFCQTLFKPRERAFSEVANRS